MFLATIVAAGYVSWFWYDHLYSSPVEMYHRTWLACAENIFDPRELKNWTKFEHCYDDKIKTNADAVLYANKMLESIDDPYTYLISPSQIKHLNLGKVGRYVGLGINYSGAQPSGHKDSITINSVVPNSPAAKAGLKPGDTILGVGGLSCKAMKAYELGDVVRAHANQPTEVLVKRGSRTKRLIIVPSEISAENLAVKKVSADTACLTLKNFVQQDTANRAVALLKRMRHCSSVILDLRDNPGGGVHECLKLASALIPEGKLVTLQIRSAGGSFTETYVLKPDCMEITLVDEIKGTRTVSRQPRLLPVLHGRKLIVLVNEGTASAAEMLTAALKENGCAKVIGSRTFGKGIAQACVPISNGALLSVTSVHYLTPQGHFLGRGKHAAGDGLEPNIVVHNGDPMKRALATAQP